MIESIFNTAYGVWNNLISITMTLFTTSPTAANGAVYSTTHTLYNAISSISLPIATVFFLIAIIKDVISSPPDQQARRFLGDGIKFGVLIGILANLWTVMGYVMQIADGVTDSLSVSATYTLSMGTDLQDVITEASTKPSATISLSSFASDLVNFFSEWMDYAMTNLLFFIAGIITLAIIVASAISIISSAYQRIIKPLAILPFSSIAVAMASGTSEANRVAVGYLKTFFGFCISGAFMVIAVKLGVALTNGMVAFNMDTLTLHEKVLYISIQNMITPIVIAGLVKSADSIIGRFF